MESGDISEADFYLKEMSQEIQSIVEMGKEGVQKVIDCTKQKIYILNMQVETEQNVKDIKECYKNCYDAIHDWANSEYCVRKFILEYANFLTKQNDPLADKKYQELVWICSKPDGDVTDEEYFNYFFNAAIFNTLQGRTKNVEKLYCKCLQKLNDMEGDSITNKYNKASVLGNLGSFYYQKGQLDDAEVKYQEIFKIMNPQKGLYHTYDESYV